MTARGRLMAAIAGAALARGSLAVLTRHPPGGEQRWRQENYAGRQVTRLAGPAFALGVIGTLPFVDDSARARTAAALAVASAAVAGVYDDLAGDTTARGLRGHGAELASGHVTTGVTKVAVLGAGGLLAAAFARGPRRDAVIAGAVIAGAANVANLLDLRPGRAIKAAVVPGVLGLSGPAGASIASGLGAAAALLPEDLAESVMLGDAGAGALGALIGVGMVSRASSRQLRRRFAVVTALVVASEFVSFSRVIERSSVLRALDRAGRRH